MNTKELINILTYYHLQEFSSGTELIQALQEDDYVRQFVAPAGGIKHSTFFDTVNDRGVEQLLAVFTELQKQAAGILPSKYSELGDLIAIDGSLIDSYVLIHFLEVSARICLECSREILLSGAIVGYGNTNQDSLFWFNRQQFFQIILYRFLVFARKNAYFLEYQAPI